MGYIVRRRHGRLHQLEVDKPSFAVKGKTEQGGVLS